MLHLLCISNILLHAAQPMTVGEVELVADGFMFTEGPVWVDDSGTLLFSDIPADTIYDQDKAVFRKPSGQSNGLTLDREDRLIACEHQNRRVTRTEKNGEITVLADKYEGKRLNSPNDVVVRSDGIIFFTDPPYGLKGGLEGPDAELDFSGVYRIDADGTLTLLMKDFIKPNGLALSPGEKVLYIADTEGKHIRAFDVTAEGKLENGRIFCELGSPDGMKMDVKGNVWATASDGVRVYSPQGDLLETIVCPQMPANCAFGGSDSRTLFITARTGLYKIQTVNAGIRPGSPTK
jgi:sugar lactone lactonase YvrE